MGVVVKSLVAVIAIASLVGLGTFLYKKYAPGPTPHALTAAQQANLAAITAAISAATPVAAATAGTTSSSAAARTYTMLPFLDSPGNTISTTPAAGLAGCNTLCDNTPGCVGTSYSAGTPAAPGSCLLKAQIASVPYNAGTTLSIPTVDFSTTFSNTIANGSSLPYGTPLVSPGGKAALVIGANNNAVLYALNTGSIVFQTNTAGRGVAPAALSMQNDNNLVLIDSKGSPLWASGTNSGTKGTLSAVLTDNALSVQDSGGNAQFKYSFTSN